MTENVQSMPLEVLKSIQASIARLDERVTRLVENVTRMDERLQVVETLVRKQRRDTAGILVIMKATVGDFEERVTEIEERTKVIEQRIGPANA